jgi:hypothetical protein
MLITLLGSSNVFYATSNTGFNLDGVTINNYGYIESTGDDALISYNSPTINNFGNFSTYRSSFQSTDGVSLSFNNYGYFILDANSGASASLLTFVNNGMLFVMSKSRRKK